MSGVGHESSSRVFVELLEHPACESLEGPADADLAGEGQGQTRGQQRAQNDHHGHGVESFEECGIGKSSSLAADSPTARARSLNMPGFSQNFSSPKKSLASIVVGRGRNQSQRVRLPAITIATPIAASTMAPGSGTTKNCITRPFVTSPEAKFAVATATVVTSTRSNYAQKSVSNR